MVFTFETEAERDKLTFIWERYKNLMLHKAYAVLRDYALAEDAVSEAMFRIYKNLHKIEDPASNRGAAFIVTVVKNAALTLLEKERRNPIALEPFEETLEDEQDLEGTVLARLGAERIRAMIDELSEELRSVFLLRYAYDMPHREIAETLGLTENNVTVRYLRARRKLAEILIREGYVHGK
jgi:RNA polymerase sigma-70 factor (ECF subfamily)